MPFSDSQLKALKVLSKKGTYREAAIAAEVSVRTIIRWMKLEDFQEALGRKGQQRTELVKEIVTISELQVVDLIPKALATIQEILENPDSRSSDRLKASELVGKWAGLGQTNLQLEKTPAEDNLKGYLSYLANTENGNGKFSNKSPNFN